MTKAKDGSAEPVSLPSTWWVYILRCGSRRDGTYYTGIAIDVDARLEKHRSGKGAKYTRSRGTLTVVYREQVGSQGDATRREMAIKKLSRQEKMALVAA